MYEVFRRLQISNKHAPIREYKVKTRCNPWISRRHISQIYTQNKKFSGTFINFKETNSLICCVFINKTFSLHIFS